MNNKTLQTILDIPVFWRAFIVLFILWLLYLIFSRGIFKLLSLALLLLSKIWLVPYLVINNIMHCIHKLAGRALIGADQAATNFFGSVYNFVYMVKSVIEGFCVRKIPLYDINGNQVLDKNGAPKYSYVSRKPFTGYALIISFLLVLWISFPTWLHTEDNNNLFNVAYSTYMGIEKEVLEMIFFETPAAI